MSELSIKVLDCTLRDGGYYTQWDFDPALVRTYLRAMAKSRVDIVEFGFRFLPQEEFLGAHAYTTDEYIRQFDVPGDITLGVMINAGDFLGAGRDAKRLLESLFVQRADSPVGLVRIAAHFHQIADCGALVDVLRSLGYRVGFNMMQTAGKHPQEVEKAVRCVASWDGVEVLYFADSLGSMDPFSVKEAVDAIGQHWDGPIGFHAHNNRGVGTMNALAAVKCGVRWIDGTVLGMGRGAGNAQLENVLFEFVRNNIADYNPTALLPLVLEEFADLQQEYQWGPHVLYHMAALNDIHPTFVQEMLNREDYDTEHVIAAVAQLSRGVSTSFSQRSLDSAVHGSEAAVPGTWDATGQLAGRSVLLLAPGPELAAHAAAVESYIARAKPYVISLNVHEHIASEYIDAYAACHRTRILMDADTYASLGKPIILPCSAQASGVQDLLRDVEVYDYGVNFDAGTFLSGNTSCTVPLRLVAPYAMAYATAAGAREILLAGFDGYAPGDPRTHDMSEVFKLYRQASDACPLRAVTRTTYDVPRASIYQPDL